MSTAEDFNYLKIEEEEKEQAERIARWSLSWVKPRSVIDFGCATGFYLEPFERRHLHVLGLEVNQRALYWNKRRVQNLVEQDISVPDLKVGVYDLGICLEVLEHMEQEKAVAACQNLGKTCRVLIFSAAVPGQGGVGHINLRPKEQWSKMLRRVGYEPDIVATRSLVDEVKKGKHLGWFVNNAMVMRNKALKK